ncbi:MAG TPA: hypothetical protein VGU69_11000 [Rhizomicrobium sp.]|nr:hypothetical protein [Rhizomicrobium sp.]
MSTIDIPADVRGTAGRTTWVTVATYSATVFLSAGLLFFLEPMFSKMVLPLLGGSAAVWSVAMVVFQGLLLAGYLYAHLLTRFLTLRRAALLHGILLVAGMAALPIAVRVSFAMPPTTGVSMWLIFLFLMSVGLPCFALSANAPLLQAWFARRGKLEAARAYFLYRASNLGSFAVLLSYPFLIEPNLGLNAQSRLWSAGYALLAVAVVACAVLALRAPTQPSRTTAMGGATVGWSDRLAWVALAFIPSGLLVAVTAYIATDVASAPFIWIIPLALYLLTFAFLFTDKPLISDKFMLAVQPACVATLVILLMWTTRVSWPVALLGHLAAFFVAAMICHARLYARRPDATQLTEFYLWMSLGGVLGGIFAALVAPHVFDTVAEYPMLAFAALLARRNVWTTPRATWIKDTIFVLAIVGMLVLAFFVTGKSVPLFITSVMVLTGLLAFQGSNPGRLLPLAAVLLAVVNLYDPNLSVLYRGRSFYGVYKVVAIDGGKFRILYQGTTAHGGEQMLDDKGAALTGRPAPLAYYYVGGPYQEAIQRVRDQAGGTLHHVALIGLGMGSLACTATPGENWTFYELDPLSVMIAHDTRLFHLVSRCLPNAPSVVGDGRLALHNARPDIDLLILDTFSSDSVPTHMLTREAFALYKTRLSPHGAIAINISNHNLQLKDVVAASAEANGMVTAVKRDRLDLDIRDTLHFPAEIAVVARSMADLNALHLGSSWHVVKVLPGTRVWTDDYSAILDAIVAKMRE